ncbi:putative PurR-regulated permease PerM [Weissella uvarum]|uniref:AI-2E family transporter n=1 Tax=Weissella uvarum TaxID=1479233 RepID=UPI0019609477|nr:AI-2E family transporter [Weissella uvarum]MBM7618091.1 putative PurR-regulated permease PerM [Weissella uvarum]MCM0595922.1 AI-2E family transporter [Weissella uvarum]
MEKNVKRQKSWFYQWFLNNKTVTALLVILLLLAVVFMVSKVSFIFEPLKVIFAAVGAPMIIAGIFYYFMNPTVDFLERKLNIKRTWIISVMFLLLLGLIVWGLAVFIPWLGSQISDFIKQIPGYWAIITKFGDEILRGDKYPQLNSIVNDVNNDLSNWFKNSSTEYAKKGVSSVSNIVSTIAKIGVSLVTFPVILFYMLKDGHRMPDYLTSLVPTKVQSSFKATLHDINKQISNYIRGQLSVAFAVMIMFGIGFTIIGLPYGWLLAVMAGCFNLIPYIGSFLAMLPALVVAISVSPLMLVYTIIVFVIEQALEGHVISPKLLGDSLQIYPVTVLVVLLSAGNLFGLPGVILGIPGYAVLKVLVTKLYHWWRHASGLFDDEQAEATKQTQDAH